MNKSLSCIILTFIILSCNSVYERVKFNGKKGELIKLEIPKNYTFQGVRGEDELEYRYWYSDSLVLYITTFENTLNYNQIRSSGRYYDRLEVLNSKDTITLSGFDDKNFSGKINF